MIQLENNIFLETYFWRLVCNSSHTVAPLFDSILYDSHYFGSSQPY